MASIGYATLQVVPSLRGMDAEVRRQLAPLDGEGRRAGTSAGSNFAEGFVAKARDAAGAVGRVIGDMVTGVAVAGGAALATALFTGWERTTLIESSVKSLTIQLGDAQAAAGLLNEVLEVVKGTPFPLDQFAAMTQMLVGMGIEADKIPGLLTAIGDAASLQGPRANEVAQRLAITFGQISAQGKIMGTDLRELSSAGVDALGILANHFGVTRDEMRDMISQGAVPATEAIDALTDGIINGTDGAAGATAALGGLMEGLGETLAGSAANFRTALARLGQSIIEPFRDALTVGFGAATGILDELGARIREVGTRIADSPGFQSFLDWMRDLPDKVGPFIDKLGEMRDLVIPLGAAFAALGTNGIAQMLGPLGSILPTLNPLVVAFGALLLQSPEVRDALGQVFSALTPVIADVAKALAPALVEMARALGEILVAVLPLVPPLAEFVALLISELGVPIIQGIAEAFSGFATALRDHRELLIGFGAGITAIVVPALATYVGGMISAAAATLAATWPLLAIGAGIAALVAGILFLWNNWDQIWNWIKDHPAIAAIVALLAAPLAAFVLLIGGLKTLYENWDEIWGAITDVVDEVLEFLEPVFDGIGALFEELEGAARIFVNFWNNGVWPVIVAAVEGAEEVVGGVLDGIGSLFGTLQGIAQGFVDVWSSAIWPGIQAAVEGARGVVEGVLTAIGYGFGILQGIAEGFSTAWSSVIWPAIQTAVSVARGVIEGAIAAIGFVIAVVQGIIEGFQTVWQTVWDALAPIVSAAKALLDPLIGGIGYIVGLVAGAAQSVWDVFSSVWSGLVDFLRPIADGVATVLGPIINTLGTIVGAARDAVKWLLRLKDLVAGGVGAYNGGPAGDGSPFGAGKTIEGATGGIVRRPTFALIGEAGPEAVIPLDRSPGNAPLSALGGGTGIVVHQLNMTYEGHDPEEFFDRVRAAVG